MKTEYPNYSTSRERGKGGLQKIKKKLVGKNEKIFNDFMNYVCLSVKKDSVKMHNVERHILQFYDVIEKPLDEITKQDVIEFFVLLNNSNRTEAYKNEIKVYVKKFLKWYYKDLEMIEVIKLNHKRYNEEKINKNSLLTKEELKQIIEGTENPKFKAWFMLAFESAGRPEELAKLKWKDVKFDTNYAEVSLYSGKTKHSRRVIIKESSKLLEIWKQISPKNSPQSYIFFSPQNKNEHMKVSSFNKAFKRLAQKVGIDKPVWNYLLRHSHLTKLYSKLPQRIVEKYAGHKGMSDIYAHLDDEDVKQAMLKEIYNIKKLSPGKQKEYEKKFAEQQKEIEKLKEKNANFSEGIKELNKITENLRECIMGHKADLEYDKAQLEKLSKAGDKKWMKK